VVAVHAPVPVVLAQVLVQAQPLPHPQLPLLAQRRRESELLAPAQLPLVLAVVVEHLVLEAAAPVQLLNLQLFSAAMAGNTLKPRATYERVPRSR